MINDNFHILLAAAMVTCATLSLTVGLAFYDGAVAVLAAIAVTYLISFGTASAVLIGLGVREINRAALPALAPFDSLR